MDAPSFTATGGGTGWTWGQTVATSPTGWSAMAGGFDGSSQFTTDGSPSASFVAEGLSDVFVALLDPTSRLAWMRRIVGESGAYPSSVAIDGDGAVTVAGYFEGTLRVPQEGGADLRYEALHESGFLVRYESDGALGWVVSLQGSGYVEALSVASAPDGSIAACGLYEGTLVLGPGEAGERTLESTGMLDGWVAAFEQDGRLRWARSTQAFGPGYATAWSVAVGSDGDIVAAGDLCGTAAFPGERAAGPTLESSTSSVDAYVVRFDAFGEPRWARRAGGPGSDVSYSVGVRKDGAVLLGGTFVGTLTVDGDAEASLTSRGLADGFVLTWDTQGQLISTFQVGGAGPDAVYAVSDRPDGCALVVGCFADHADLGPGGLVVNHLDSAGTADCEGFVACLTPLGDFAWSTRLGGLGDDHAVALAVFPDDDALVGGSYVGAATLGDVTLPEATLPDAGGPSQALFLRLAPDGTYRP